MVYDREMKRLVGLAIAAALALPAAAYAKGPDQATIRGPGVDGAIVLRGFGESGTGTMGRLTMEAGFFPEVFGQQPDPRLHEKPANLGPRYRVAYRVPGPEVVTLHQDLYPHAAGGLVTFMRPGQPLWDGQRTKGGWIRAPELAPGQQTLRAALITKGLPATSPTRGSGLGWPTLGWTAATAAAISLAVAAVAALRRYPRRRSAGVSRA